MNGHNLIVVGLVLVALTAHVAVWWTNRWTWDGIVMVVVLCLAGMAVERNQRAPMTAKPDMKSLPVFVSQLTPDELRRLHAIEMRVREQRNKRNADSSATKGVPQATHRVVSIAGGR